MVNQCIQGIFLKNKIFDKLFIFHRTKSLEGKIHYI